jgi:hypothetical protein
VLAAVLVTTAQILAGAWMGGILVTGALVAPVVFHRVPAPTSGDAMTEVFMRFDRVALGIAAALVFLEVTLAFVRKPLHRIDAARLLLTIALVGLIVTGASWISPAIAALHQAGAIRGIGEGGAEIERLHVVAKRIGVAELLALGAFVGLHVARLRRLRRPGAPVAPVEPSDSLLETQGSDGASGAGGGADS